MNSAENAVQWRDDHASWFLGFGLLLCVAALVRIPGWWRGSFNSGLSLGRQRTYLVQWVGGFFLVAGASIGSLPPGIDQISKARAGLSLLCMAVGILFLLLIPLVWHFRVFEFLVPPRLRRDVPGGPPDFGSGRPLAAAIAAASNAPERAPARKPAVTGPAGSGMLRFERPWTRWRDRLATYRVELDDGEVGTLRNGADFTIPVAAGIHTVRAAVSFTGSPTVEVQVRAGETTVVRIGPIPGNSLVQIAAPDTYLAIEVGEA
jgi:hypothetical protein